MWPKLALKAIPKRQFQKCFEQWYHLQIKGRTTQSDSKRQDFPSTALDHSRGKGLQHHLLCASYQQAQMSLFSVVSPASGIVLGMEEAQQMFVDWLNDIFEGTDSGLFVSKNCLTLWSHLNICILTVDMFSMSQMAKLSTRPGPGWSAWSWACFHDTVSSCPYPWPVLHSVWREMRTRH